MQERDGSSHHQDITSMKIAYVGAGDVLERRYGLYLAESPYVKVLALSDRNTDRARQMAKQFDTRARTTDAILADPEIELIVNLTSPKAHMPINEQALRAGKHVYSEKPFVLSVKDGDKLNRLAKRMNRQLATAPDTLLGPNAQLAINLVRSGKIGTPYMARTSFIGRSEEWLENPDHLYQEGGGPIFDEGAYFLLPLVNMFGSIEKVSSMSETYEPERTIGSGPRKGEKIISQIPTSYLSNIKFRTGVMLDLWMTFDARGSSNPPIEIYGSKGTVKLCFPGFYNKPDDKPTEKKASVEYFEYHDGPRELLNPDWETCMSEARGLGVEEQVIAINNGRESRLSGRLGLHIVEAQHAIIYSAQLPDNRAVHVKTNYDIPEAYNPNENVRNIRNVVYQAT